MSSKSKIIIAGLLLLVICITIPGYLLYNGFIWFNNPSSSHYPVRGIDVSGHQKNINWKLVKSQNIDFAYIKATEGKGFIDKYFKVNWDNAKKLGLKVGAYHFFTFSSNGLDQARNFIKNVPKEEGSLPPVIDIEFGGNSKNTPDKKTLDKELNVFITQIRNYFGQEPIIYALYDSYEKYIMDSLIGNSIWIRDIIKHPELKDKRRWIFWQYCNRGRLKGVSGFVDLNVFNGNKDDFEKLLLIHNDSDADISNIQ